MVSISDKFGKASIDSDHAIATTVKTIRSSGGSVLEAYDVSKFPTDTPAYFVTYKKTTDPGTGVVSVTNLVSWKALVNTGANTLTNLTVAPGYVDAGNAVGDFIELVPTSYWENSMVDGILTHSNPDGTLKADTVTTPAITDASVTPAKWANPYKFFAYRSSAWSTNGATAGLVTFNTEDYDTNSNFDTATGKYTAPVDGYYHFSYSIAHGFTNNVQSEIYKNNSSYIKSPQNYNSATYAIGGTSQSFDIKLTAGDYIQIYHYASPTTTGTASRNTNFSGYLVSQT